MKLVPYKLERKGNDWVWWFKQFTPLFIPMYGRKPRKWA